ncbi:hypothetical protein EYF80_054363 [Liparis tanakae]|uniref:Uncharacterized protein n=1 Tax=Liparis tanakae TaxID=230148 RepID=A0A4Z2F342_9TELE|nr:hypothetical protein EYF80_054363 [Liparis tanakae]
MWKLGSWLVFFLLPRTIRLLHRGAVALLNWEGVRKYSSLGQSTWNHATRTQEKTHFMLSCLAMLSMGSMVPRMALRKGTMPYTRGRGRTRHDGTVGQSLDHEEVRQQPRLELGQNLLHDVIDVLVTHSYQNITGCLLPVGDDLLSDPGRQSEKLHQKKKAGVTFERVISSDASEMRLLILALLISSILQPTISSMV